MMEESQRAEATSSAPPSKVFWQEFARRYWERAPFAATDSVATEGSVASGSVASKGVVDAPSAESLFRTIVRCCEPARKEGWVRCSRDVRSALRREQPPLIPGRARIRFLIEGSDRVWVRKKRFQLQSVVLPHQLPREEDGSFEGYNARMDALLNPSWRVRVGLPRRRYGLIVNFPEHVDFGLWQWARRFLHPLFDALGGMNNAGSYIAVFIGNYQRTAFGVHPDPESVFHVPVIGRKAMRTWESSYVKEHPDLEYALRYDKHVHASTRTEAAPGGFVYWPSKLWHVAESESSDSSSSAGEDLSVAMAVSLLCKGEESDRKVVPFDPNDLQASAGIFPEKLHPLTPFKTPLRLNTQRARDEAWLRLVTGASFILPPHPLPTSSSSPPKRVRLNRSDANVTQSAALAWLDRGDEILVGANGTVFSTKRESLSLLHQLNEGSSVPSGSDLIDWLWRTRCVSTCS